jgi:hypothetical protein
MSLFPPLPIADSWRKHDFNKQSGGGNRMGKKRRKTNDDSLSKTLLKKQNRDLDGLGIMLVALATIYAERYGREAALQALGTAAEALAPAEK